MDVTHLILPSVRNTQGVAWHRGAQRSTVADAQINRLRMLRGQDWKWLPPAVICVDLPVD